MVLPNACFGRTCSELVRVSCGDVLRVRTPGQESPTDLRGRKRRDRGDCWIRICRTGKANTTTVRNRVTLLYAMADRKGKRGIATLCLGGGEAVALLVDRP
jgi:hypothetical protein